ncbi:hypothetical protein SF83666_c30380 [Sinorhizobium fredii CCBAU 83666]|nr:hypothetical protein SF83666_c30380 [Sinorhizobium fredii CCBAU 83666]
MANDPSSSSLLLNPEIRAYRARGPVAASRFRIAASRGIIVA